MRLVLIAYEFPPSPSPQSLRWSFLVRGLLSLGAEVHVLTVDPWWAAGSALPPEGCVVHRVWPGGIAWMVELGRHWRRIRGRLALRAGFDSEKGSSQLGASGTRVAVQAGRFPEALNWKGRLLKRVNILISRFTFPDERGRWEPYARRRLRKLLLAIQPDVVISSHEPATTLRLGRMAKQSGFRWVADLGDPVLSFYTPDRWKKKSVRLERWTCCNADLITVTTEAAQKLLAERHCVPESKFAVLTQGYDPSADQLPQASIEFDQSRLELLYTGSFYHFREPRELVDAVLAIPGARLNIATSRPPEWLMPLLDEHPGHLRLLGFVPHARSVALQRSADVLVNIANEDPVHVPGKVYEYLGAGRPILHIGDHAADVAARLVQDHRRGLVCRNSAASIAAVLEAFVTIKRRDAWAQEFQLDQAEVEHYRWQSIAGRLNSLLAEVIKSP